MSRSSDRVIKCKLFTYLFQARDTLSLKWPHLGGTQSQWDSIAIGLGISEILCTVSIFKYFYG